jgi:NAD(P)-dependent dehydrogenase (short-subunit alcohol dehydrogenase family)
MAQMQSSLVESLCPLPVLLFLEPNNRGRLDRLTQSAKELSDATGNTCIPVQADVRQPKTLYDAVAKTIEKFGRIDFVICGTTLRRSHPGSELIGFIGAAGNFLATIDGMSENAFKTVLEIDSVCASHNHKMHYGQQHCVDGYFQYSQGNSASHPSI